MRKWSKKIGVLGGCLVGLGGLFNPVHAQFGGSPPFSRAVFADEPQAPVPPDFPNPGNGGTEKVSPFSLRDDGAPNAFTIIDAPPATYNYHFVARTEYLGWWVSPIRVPAPLVTTSTANPFTANDFGALGQPSTIPLFDAGNRNYSLVSGGRLTLGIAPGFVPPIEVSGMWLGQSDTLFALASTGTPLIARPVALLTVPTITGGPSESAYLVAGPGFGTGVINIGSSLNVWGIDTDMFCNLCDNGTIQIDFIAGYKYLEMNEHFIISSSYIASVPTAFNAIPGGVPPGLPVSVTDDFYTRNQFNGGTIGLRGRLNMGSFMLTTDVKLSMGSTFQYSPLNGNSTLGGPGGNLPVTAGILALPSNALLTRHEFSIVPEANVSLSYQVTPNIRIFGGYNVLAWTQILRAAEQIQTAIDPTQVPTDFSYVPGQVGTGPQHPGRMSTFFANGFNAGLEIGF
jgi:hypothetical protein